MLHRHTKTADTWLRSEKRTCVIFFQFEECGQTIFTTVFRVSLACLGVRFLLEILGPR
jgi:hypothetical protein